MILEDRLKETKSCVEESEKALHRLECIVGIDVIDDSGIYDAVDALKALCYNLVEDRYDLPYGDVEWLESNKWLRKGLIYKGHISGREYLVEGIEGYVNSVE